MVQNLLTISGAIMFRVYFMVASMAITLALSRHLGLEEFGRYTWLVGIAFLLSGLSLAGGNSLVVRETSRTSGKQAPLEILARVALVSGGTLFSLAAVALFFTRKEMAWAQLLPLLLMAGSHLMLVLLGASARGIGLIQKGQIPELVMRPTLFLLWVGLLVLMGWSLSAEEVIYLQVASYLAVILFAAGLFLNGLKTRPVKPQETIEPGWLLSFFRLGAVGWLAVANDQLLVILTGYLSSYGEVGLFRVASQGVLIMGLGFSAFETIQAPALARAYKSGDHHSMHLLLQQSCRIGLLISAAVMIFLIITGRLLLRLLFGGDFVAAYAVLSVLAAAQLINASTGNVGLLMIAAKREGKLIYGNSLALMITLLSAVYLIPKYGALAAAFSSGLGLITKNILAAWFCWRAFGILALPFAPYRSRPVDGDSQ